MHTVSKWEINFAKLFTLTELSLIKSECVFLNEHAYHANYR